MDKGLFYGLIISAVISIFTGLIDFYDWMFAGIFGVVIFGFLLFMTKINTN